MASNLWLVSNYLGDQVDEGVGNRESLTASVLDGAVLGILRDVRDQHMLVPVRGASK